MIAVVVGSFQEQRREREQENIIVSDVTEKRMWKEKTQDNQSIRDTRKRERKRDDTLMKNQRRERKGNETQVLIVETVARRRKNITREERVLAPAVKLMNGLKKDNNNNN